MDGNPKRKRKGKANRAISFSIRLMREKNSFARSGQGSPIRWLPRLSLFFLVYGSSESQPGGLLSTVAPSAGSSNFQWQEILYVLNWSMMRCAISLKFAVARARIVGPAPDRQIPSNPGWERGFIDCKISARPGIRCFRYGW